MNDTENKDLNGNADDRDNNVNGNTDNDHVNKNASDGTQDERFEPTPGMDFREFDDIAASESFSESHNDTVTADSGKNGSCVDEDNVEADKDSTDADTKSTDVDTKSSDADTKSTDVDTKSADDVKSSQYEDVCFVCRRPESKAGRMYHLPNNICICEECMHKMMDTVSQFDYQGMLGNMPNDSDNNSDDNGDENGDGNSKKHKINGFPNISFLNLSDLQGDGAIPNKQKIHKKKEHPEIDIRKIPAPHIIKGKLDEYVVGQEHAKKVISVAVYNHYKRLFANEKPDKDGIEIEKSNMLMIGPTGCGKTYMVKTLAKLLDVPLAIADATSLTEAGYIGDDIESVVSKLLAAADNDIERTQQGIIFIDEIDKLAKKENSTARDVNGESVQQGMLKLLEGAKIEVPVGSNSKNAMVPLATVDTTNILFICGGAFPELEEVIKRRLHKETAIGYTGELRDKYDKDKNILSKVATEDLRSFGMIPEFIGRLPIIFTLEPLSKEMMIRILNEPKNAILKQYKKLLELDEVDLRFDDDALAAIAEKAMKRDTGARALKSIIEDFMLDIMYEIPKDDNIGRVTITRDYIEGTGGPVIDIRSESASDPDKLNEIDDEVVEEKKIDGAEA